jgi:uncharacterized phage protein gp47/JayE
MANGVTAEGFIRPRLPEIRLEIIAALVGRLQAIGFSEPIETRPERETALWEQAEAVYYAMYPSSASGAQLDRAVSFTGVSRLPAEPSLNQLILYGADGTIVPAGSQVKNRNTQSLWELPDAVTIGLGAVADTLIRPVVAALTAYTITIDGTPYTFVSDASPTLAEILAGLVAQLAASGHTISSDGAVVRIVAAGEASFALQVSASLQVVEFGSPALARSVEDGPITAEVGELTEIVTLVPGWDRVNNLQVASLGRLTETDAALRTRYKSGVYALGAATLPALQANLESRVPGITSVRVFENDTDVVDVVGRPPHSIHVVAQGGLDSEIAAAIFQYKAAGIDTFGAIETEVIDSEGTAHEIHHDRPTPVYIWVKANLTLLPASEEAFPPDGFTIIANNLLAAGNALGVGRDVIWQRLLGAVHAVKGVAEAELLLAETASPLTVPAPGDYVEANITIADFELAMFDASRIQVA